MTLTEIAELYTLVLFILVGFVVVGGYAWCVREDRKIKIINEK